MPAKKKRRIPNANTNPTHPKQIEARHRHAEWVALRRQRRSITSIAAQYGVAKSSVSAAITNLMAEVGLDDAEALRAEQNAELNDARDVVLAIMHDDAQEPLVHLAAVDRYVRVSKRRSEINGSDMPPRAPVDDKGQTVRPYDINELRAILTDANA